MSILSSLRAHLIRAATMAQVQPSAWRQGIALAGFLACLGASIYGGAYLGWLEAQNYWIEHFLFGLGVPMLFYSLTGSLRLAVIGTLFWSLGNELITDQLDGLHTGVDWDHLSADLAGIAIAFVLLRSLRRASIGTPSKP